MRQLLIFIVWYLLYQIECSTISRDIHQIQEIENQINEIPKLRRSLISLIHKRTLLLNHRSELLSQVHKKEPQFDHTDGTKVKRSPSCIYSCLMRKLLHPAQCHSYCTAG